jgi:putative hydrolase of the HAD superfamily
MTGGKIKAFLFDFGGTLDINGKHWSVEFWEVYESLGVPVSYEEFRQAYIFAEDRADRIINEDYSLYNTLETKITLQFDYLKKNNADIDDKTVDAITKRCYADIINNISETKRILKKFNSFYKTALVSNYYGNLKTICQELNIDEYFDAIVESSKVKIYKPDPRIFEIALQKLEIEPKEAAVVGDSYDRDIIPAKRIGCATIWLKGKSWKEQNESTAADFIITSIEELDKFLS